MIGRSGEKDEGERGLEMRRGRRGIREEVGGKKETGQGRRRRRRSEHDI